MGAHVATAGVVVFLIATYLDWVSTDGEQSATGSGYETDTSIALVAFLGIGLAVALQYALKRACGRQHRGLSLTALAVGIAAVCCPWATSWTRRAPSSAVQTSPPRSAGGSVCSAASCGQWALPCWRRSPRATTTGTPTTAALRRTPLTDPIGAARPRQLLPDGHPRQAPACAWVPVPISGGAGDTS